MAQQVSGTFTNTGWEEAAYAEIDDQRKLSEVSASFAYAGDVTGESVLKYLMSYNSDGTCDYYGLERITGTIDGHQGSFTLQQRGQWSGHSLSCELTIVEGSGDGDLSGISGDGQYTWDMQAEHGNFTINYEIDEA